MESFTEKVSYPSVLQEGAEIHQERKQKKDKCTEASKQENNSQREIETVIYSKVKFQNKTQIDSFRRRKKKKTHSYINQERF